MPAAPNPLISIVVVCRNPGPPLRTALQSIWDQANTPTFEILVIDGASTDGTAHWLAEHQTQLGYLSSEPDRGVYDAMNKGIRAARGDWLYFLGADDRLATQTVLQAIGPHLTSSTTDIVAAEVRYSDGRVYATRRPLRPCRRNPLHHQSTFYRRTGMARFGPFDATLAIAADYDLNLRWLQAGATLQSEAILVAHCTAGGLSDAGHWLTYREEISVRHRHFAWLACLPWDLFSCVRFVRKQWIRIQRRISHGQNLS